MKRKKREEKKKKKRLGGKPDLFVKKDTGSNSV
jgi:hypothetical protein